MTLSPAHASLAQRIEHHFFIAWPAMAEMNLDGWQVRIAGGYSDRANCVTPRHVGAMSWADKLKWCERFYNDRQLPVIVRVSDLCLDVGLDQWLDDRRYRMSWKLETAAAPLAATPPPPQVHISATATDAWVDAALSTDSKIALHLTPFRHIIAHMPQPSAFASIITPQGAVAVGAATVEQDLMGIFLMRTKAEARRQGHARAILNALMSWGRSNGASTAWLQFDQDGEAQTKLYRGAGFQAVYRYHYRKQTTSQGR